MVVRLLRGTAIAGLLVCASSTALERLLTADTNPAMSRPTAFAWELFAEINRPADPAAPDGAVAWERWALARRVFERPLVEPTWADVSAPDTQEDLEVVPLQQALRAGIASTRPELLREVAARGTAPEIDPGVGQGNETRMNRPAFDFIVRNKLWFVEGQEEFFYRGESPSFPVEAREIKAQWRRIRADQRSRYHARKLVRNGAEEWWGLTSLHITTKDIPNWVWATFEHRENPGREAVVPSVDPTGLPASLKGTKWENYVLRGAQVDFVDPTGRPVLLASSQIEQEFQQSSSCMTCHARATIGPPARGPVATQREAELGTRLPVFLASGDGPIGVPDPAWFRETSTAPPARTFVQLDFVWSLFRARRQVPLRVIAATPPSGPGTR